MLEQQFRAYGAGQVLAVAGSRGCWVSGVVCTVIQAFSGSNFRIASISPAFRARQRPSERRCPASAQRSAEQLSDGGDGGFDGSLADVPKPITSAGAAPSGLPR